MSSATLSIRLPIETHRWLERFAKRRGSAGMAASRVLEEAKRREEFSALDFRDTPVGRLAYVHGTRVPIAMVYRILRDRREESPADIAVSFHWPLWKAESALAYAKHYREELERELADLESCEEGRIQKILPGLEIFEAEPE